MHDFTSRKEICTFVALGPMGPASEQPLREFDFSSHGRSLRGVGVTSEDAFDYVTRLLNTFCLDAKAPGGGDVAYIPPVKDFDNGL